jgi:hypothetical protein
MPSLAECKIASLTAQGYTTGKINEREYAWLADQTGQSGLSLNGQWHYLLTDLGYTTGSLNEKQIKSWVDLGAPSSKWNEAAYWFWCVNGGAYIPISNDPLILWGNQPHQIESYVIDDASVTDNIYFYETGVGAGYHQTDFSRSRHP